MTNSRAKGVRGELEVSKLVKAHGFEARRGQQYAGGGDSPDVVHSMDGFHIEVKRVENLSLYVALEQAKRDKRDEEIPIIFHKRNNKEWVVIMPAEDFLTLAEELYEDG